MPDNRTTRLLPASFKGVQFLVRNEAQTEGGRKIVLHEYPNSSTRYVEDLGEIPPKFTLSAFVAGDTWKERDSALRRALDSSEAGSLVMPTFGAITVFALPYRRNADQKSVGEISYELEFAVGKKQPAPSRGPKTQQSVFNAGDEAREALADAFGELWITPENQAAATTSQGDLVEAIDLSKTLVAAVSSSDDLALFNAIADEIESDRFSLTRSGGELGPKLFFDDGSGLFEAFSVSLGEDGDGFDAALDFTLFGSSLSLSLSDIARATSLVDELLTGSPSSTAIPLWPATTSQRINRNRNRVTLVRSVRVAALVSAYEQLAAKSYSTVSEINAARETVEDAHDRILRVETADREAPQSNGVVRGAVENVRLAALEVLEQKEQQAFNIVGIMPRTPQTSIKLSHILYFEQFENIDDVTKRADGIAGLNKANSSQALRGNVSVFQVPGVQS